MKTIAFTNRGAFYGCSQPGDQSGEYVRAEVARGLVEALTEADRLLSVCEFDDPEDVAALERIHAAAAGETP